MASFFVANILSIHAKKMIQGNDLQERVARAMLKVIADVRIESLDEFDRNFTRRGFFTDAWKRKKHDDGHPILMKTGTLRRSIVAQQTGTSLEFGSSEKYAVIHNNGGEIHVTAKMKRYFWAMYQQATGKISQRKDGTNRKTKKNVQLSADAAFYKAMALKKVGSTIVIPKRQFIGMSPQLREAL